MNSFIITRLQRKLGFRENRKFSENPLSGPGLGSLVPPMRRALGLRSHLEGRWFRVPGPTYDMGLGSRVPPTVPGFGSHVLDMPIKTTKKVFQKNFHVR